MLEAVQTEPAIPALANSSVARCCDAASAARRAALAQQRSNYSVTSAAQDAYRKAMPLLNGSENIRDFVACVSHGMMIEVFSFAESSKLLYAAQVAGTLAQKLTEKTR